MATQTTAIRLAGYPVVDVRALREEVAAWNALNPSSPIFSSTFEGKANSFRWTTGRTPGSGWVLMLWQYLSTLDDLSVPVDLEFEVGGQIVALQKVVILNAIKVCGHTDDPAGVYIVQLTDKRHHARRSAFNKQFNATAPEGYTYLGTRQPAVGLPGAVPVNNTWETMTEAVWSEMPSFGPWPGFPQAFLIPPDDPRDFRWPYQSPYDALDVILKHLDLVLNLDPIADTITIAEHGSGNDVNQLAQTVATWPDFMLDSQPKENIASEAAGIVRVCFHSRDWTFGEDLTLPTTQDSWQFKTAHTIDLENEDGEIGTTEILWDDLPAEYDINGRLTNEGQLIERAKLRYFAYVQSQYLGGARFKRVYSGLCNGDFRTSGALCGVSYHDFGDGIKTTVLNTDRSVTDRDFDWNDPGIISLAQETVKTPSIARRTIPFQRLAWVQLVSDVKAGKCGRAVVLHAEEQLGGDCFSLDFGSGVNVQWGPTFTRQGQPLIIEVNEVTGKQEFFTDERLVAWYHWQAKRWTLINGSGGDAGWWVILTDRCERAYSWKHVIPQSSGWPITRWVQCSNPGIFVPNPARSGILNAFDVNGCAFNVQGGAEPLVVWMRRGGLVDAAQISQQQSCVPAVLPTDPPVPYYLIDLGGTNECDGERLEWNP
jgi:hypothetical protein